VIAAEPVAVTATTHIPSAKAERPRLILCAVAGAAACAQARGAP